jgi:hypothetical protein
VKARGCANLAIAVSAAIWALLFLRAANHYSYVATFGYPGATGVWDFWVYLPLGMAIGLLLCALVFNLAFRSAGASLVLAVAALLAVPPYLVMTSGGV